MFIIKKKISGKGYYYLRDSKRVDENGQKKIKAVSVAYLGKTKKEAEKKAREIIDKIKMEKVKNDKTNPENMNVKITYFVHGTTTDNLKEVSSGWYDVELSEKGIKQSEELPKQIGNKKFDVVFCSDLKRAVDSANISFKNKYKIISDKRLRECNYGDYNAKPSSIVEPMQEENITKRFPNGESYEDVKKRIADFLNYLSKNYKGKHIAIVAHKAPQLAIEVLLNNKTLEQAFSEDWRKRKAWQPGWEYEIRELIKLEDNQKNMVQEEKKIIKEEPKKEQSESEFRKILMSYVSEKGFVYGPSPEIYGGMAGFYDFGPAGKTLKNNIENTIRKLFNKFQFFEVECPIVTPKIVWEASGHLGGFSDPLVKCLKCNSIWRVDNIISEQFEIDADPMTLDQLKEFLVKNNVICPSCKTRLNDDVKKHSLMLKTQVGIDTEMYNRPETATTTYLPFLNYLRFYREKLPFGVFQIGNAYRNEISPRQHVIRGREFTQAEAQLFLFKDQKENFERFSEVEHLVLPFYTANHQKEGKGIIKMSIGQAIKNKVLKNKAYAWTLGITYQLFKSLGLSDDNLRYKQHMPEKLAFYADDAWDLEVRFNSFGWIECCGVHDRTDYDLTTHGKFSGKDLSAINILTNKREIPHVLEIAIGPNRLLLAVLDNFYDKKSEEQGKTKLNMPAKLAPIKAAIFPLMKKEPLQKVAKEVFDSLSNDFLVVLDESGSIGKRYLRQDEIGTPLCITIDYDTLEKDNSVTIRDRNSEKQIRVKISELREVVRKVVEGEDLLKLGKLVETRVKEE